MKDSGERRQFKSGAVRDRGGHKPRPDLISPHANLREGEWLRKGAEKYDVDNWTKGMPIRECVASLARHLESYKLGLTDEDHMAAIRTNAGFILHYEEEIKAGRLPASLDDMPHYTAKVRPSRQEQLDDEEAFGIDFKTGKTVAPCPPNAVEAMNVANLSDPNPAPSDIEDGRVTRDVKKGEVLSVDLEEYRKLGFHSQEVTGSKSRNRLHCNRCGYEGPSCNYRGKLVDVRDVPLGEVVQCPGCVPPLPPPSTTDAVEILHRHCGKPFTVYLCGPITGVLEDSAWRTFAAQYLTRLGIKVLDPMRGKDLKKIENQGMNYMGQPAAPEIASRDSDDIKEADVIFAHFPYEPPRQSIGSLMEMGAAAIGFGKPVLLCTKVKVFSEHLFCRNFCTIEPDYEQALRRIEAMAKAKQR